MRSGDQMQNKVLIQQNRDDFILNEDLFGPLQNDSIVIVVQVKRMNGQIS